MDFGCLERYRWDSSSLQCISQTKYCPRLPMSQEVAAVDFSHPEELQSDPRGGARALRRASPASTGAGSSPTRYPTEFVDALTEQGWLAALIPEEYGGSGLAAHRRRRRSSRRSARRGGNAGACHAQMYTMGTLLRHGSDEQKQRYLPQIAAGELRLQAFGSPSRAPAPTRRSIKTTRDAHGDGGYRSQRPEDLDLARPALRPDAPARAHDAARRGREARPTASRFPRRHARAAATR